MNKLILCLAIVFLTGCTRPEKATLALQASGYTEIKMNGYAFFGCDENDTFRDSFTAKGANGKSVDGSVCGTLFKGSTIRVD